MVLFIQVLETVRNYKTRIICNVFNELFKKGRSKLKKMTLFNVCNKLLKQAFAIAKLGLIYDDSYRSKLVIK